MRKALVFALGLASVGCGARDSPPRVQALYVPMRDGVRIAIDLWLPENFEPGQKIPALMQATRYWRALDVVADEGVAADSNFETASRLNEAGYAYAVVDARGTGASFGSRDYEYTVEEVRDYGEIVDWIVEQPWSNGRVGAFGVSYSGTTAELLAVTQHPAVRAVAPLYPDFDAFDHLIYPGNVFLNFFTDDWGHAVRKMDENDICGVRRVSGADCEALRATTRGVKPVDDDVDGRLLARAVEEHKDNVDVAEAARSVEFHDDPFGAGGANAGELGAPSSYLEEIAASGTAIFTRVGWLDAATVNGALSRFNSLPNPQRVVIGALSHGGGYDADPFREPDEEPDPSHDAQFQNLIGYFDTFLKEEGDPSSFSSEVRYYRLGSGDWHMTTDWPPEGFEEEAFFLGPGGTLGREVPAADGRDRYVVDFTASTGEQNRWHTQMGGGDVIYPDRADEDEKLLTYTSDPMSTDVEITGHPQITIFVRSTEADGAFFVYLEDVGPEGRVTYITEGQLRAASRKISEEEPPYHYYGPYRSFRRVDAEDLVPGEVVELTFDLWATSVLIRRGHRVRIAVACADADNFARYPLDGGAPTVTVERSRSYPSRIVLPMKER